MKRSFSIMMALMLSLMVVYMSVVADGKNKPLSEEVSRTWRLVAFTKVIPRQHETLPYGNR